ncbi:MAG: hypothetical protein ABIP01_01100 [Candidatus Limnocylindria bacterium]
MFAAPARNMLLSFDATVPAHVIVDMTTALEDMDPHPLLIDPFVLTAGRLTWEGLALDVIDEPMS